MLMHIKRELEKGEDFKNKIYSIFLVIGRSTFSKRFCLITLELSQIWMHLIAKYFHAMKFENVLFSNLKNKR